MTKIKFEKKHVTAIKKAVREGGDIWYNTCLKSVKSHIKAHYRGVKDRCCYCKRSLKGEFNMVIDIEHVLPQSLYKKYIFSMKNLGIACKRCNMRIKGNNVDFLNLPFKNNKPFHKGNYKLIHPYLDDYSKNLKRIVLEEDDLTFIKYTIINDSQKGKYTYDFFKLYEFEEDQINKAQGMEIVERYIC
ncbi:TPA: HNH endonuclease [Enterobacter hormaechei subsp. xiangfangensis]|nr:HNH endonuclease [Enterobacter hormaechei subsp. xiangfangensis]